MDTKLQDLYIKISEKIDEFSRNERARSSSAKDGMCQYLAGIADGAETAKDIILKVFAEEK